LPVTKLTGSNQKSSGDLYHRFIEFSITVPPLRERGQKTLCCAEFFLDKTNTELDKTSPDSQKKLLIAL
jgi:two-component system response regulator HydG